MKTEVYSWRLSPKKKAELEEEASHDNISVSELLDRITSKWLANRKRSPNGDEAEQARIRKRMMPALGSIRSGDPMLSERTSELVRAIILKKHMKESRASHRTG